MLFSYIAYGQEKKATNNFILKGTTTDPKTHAVWLTYSIGKQQRIKRKAYVKNGSFSFNGFIPSPLYAELYFNSKPLSNHDWGINEVFLSPGNITIRLTGDSTTNALITGSDMHDDWSKLEKQKKLAKQLKIALYGKINEYRSSDKNSKNQQSSNKVTNSLDLLENAMRQLDYQFASTHPSSYLSAYLTNYYFDGMEDLSLDSTTTFYNSFTDSVKNSVAGRLLYANILKHKSSARGAKAPLFIGKDMQGKILNLKSFKNKKYVILYFWASFCFPEKAEAPFLNRLYKKYHTKGLEIIGLSMDGIDTPWKNSIAKSKMNMWHNVLIESADLKSKYNIDGMPPSILILVDKKGEIIGRYMGDHQAWNTRGDSDGNIDMLETKLVETMGK